MSWISTIAQGIETAFNAVRPALPMLPALLLLCELKKRPGLSAIALSAAIIKRLPEAGIETGVNPDGSPNKINKFTRIIAEEVIKEFKDNCVINLAIDAGSVISTGTGGNAGGPVVVTSTNIMPISGYGVPR